jgi:beta-lactamase superfamily II metal-dependent hydrolase
MKIKFLKASRGDCFCISYKDDDNITRNIIIDGGICETYFDSPNNREGELKTEIDRIRNNNEKVDLLILTHIDNDHILGLLKWFEMDKIAPEIIDNVWFNSGKLIADYLKKPENLDLNLVLKIFKTTETGTSEGIDFEKYLLDNKIWERKIVKTNTVLKENGVEIQVLSPNKKQLKKLLKKYHEDTKDPAYTGGIKNDWDDSIENLIKDDELNYNKPKDYSPKNQSSITFILTIKDKSFLFLADAPSNIIVKELDTMGFNSANPLKVEFMKVSHHGSKNNTCKDLLRIVKTDNYLISTSGSHHGHPNKRTLARILNINKKANFHFNYEDVKDNIISKQDYKDYEFLRTFVTPVLKY